MSESDGIPVRAMPYGIREPPDDRNSFFSPSRSHQNIPLPIGAAMGERLRHRLQETQINRPTVSVVQPRYATHVP